jgi:hypothetical protein
MIPSDPGRAGFVEACHGGNINDAGHAYSADVSLPSKAGAALSLIAMRRRAVRSDSERRAKAKRFVAPSPDGRGAGLYWCRGSAQE